MAVWFLIDEMGSVQRALLKDSSGHEALDEAARSPSIFHQSLTPGMPGGIAIPRG